MSSTILTKQMIRDMVALRGREGVSLEVLEQAVLKRAPKVNFEEEVIDGHLSTLINEGVLKFSPDFKRFIV